MAGSLILIDSDTASSSSSISLTGMDSTYDVYVAIIENVTYSASAYDYIRFTVGGYADTSANYDSVMKVLRGNGAFYNGAYSNQTFTYLSPYQKGTNTGSQTNATFYIFNSQNSSEYTFATFEESFIGTSGAITGSQGGMVLTETQITDGINFSPSAGNYPSGEFLLYGLKK
tara:strand:+ start:51 stop:566 length:516 start_codon:yes stop_codon:yes gene_type:complete